MSIKKYFKFGLYSSAFSVIVLFVFLTMGQKTVFAKASCTVLTKNLSFGSTNSSSGFQVTSLQNFLYANNYLGTSATGRYGNLTVAAVKKFQSDNSISAIGTVGPITRAAIQKISCSVLSSTVTNTLCSNGNVFTGNCMTASVGLAVAPVSVPENNLISSPSIGVQLTTGQKYSIIWTGSNNQPSIDILLKDENGAGAGYVATGLSGTTNNYNWTTGNVSIAGQQAAVVPPGDYQLNIVDDASWGSAFNIKSAIFHIAEAPLFITHILPTQVSADGKTTVVLYGSGFSNLTRITLTGSNMFNSIIAPQSVSSDGSFIWFYVPQYFTPGQYQVSVYNDYSNSDTTATSTPSNYVNLQINSI